jgi:hypothetical protein
VIRRLFTFASLASLLLLLATATLWVRGHCDFFTTPDRRIGVYLERNAIRLEIYGIAPVDQSFAPTVHHGFTFAGIDDHAGIKPRANYFRDIYIHCALVLLLTAILPTLWLVNWRMRRRDREQRIDQGLCLACRYDLAGNASGVCPECGNPTLPERVG